MRIEVRRVEGSSLNNAPFDTLRYSGSVAPNYTIRSQKHKTKTLKKENNFARQRGLSAKLSKAGCWGKLPSTASRSGSIASNYTIGSQKPKN